MITLRELVLAYLAVVGLVLAGIGTGYFNEGPGATLRPPSAAATAKPSAPARPTAPPARPATSPTAPATTPAPLYKAGDTVDGLAALSFESCEPPCSVFRRNDRQAVFRLMVQGDNHVVITMVERTAGGAPAAPKASDPAFYGTLDPSTGYMSGTLESGGGDIVGRWSGVLMQRGGRLEAEGRICLTPAPASSARLSVRNAGGHFWGPEGRSEPTGLGREPGCPPDDASLAGVPLVP